MTEPVTAFNDASPEDLMPALTALTAAPEWAEQLIDGRPYPGLDDVLVRSDEILAQVPESQIDAALAGHPRIGEKHTGPAEQAQRSADEQAGLASADDSAKQSIADANAAYEKKFGRIYLIAAAGLSADELLTTAQSRLDNDPITELDVVRDELARITRLRLTAYLT